MNQIPKETIRVCIGCGEEKPMDQFEVPCKINGKPRVLKRRKCHDCIRLYYKSYYRRDGIKERQKEYRKQNPDKVKQWKKDEYLKNKDKILEAGRKWYELNKDKARETMKRWREQNPDNSRESHKKARNNLADWYIIDRLKREFGFTNEEIKSNPELIEFKRQQIILRRMTGWKGTTKGKNKK